MAEERSILYPPLQIFEDYGKVVSSGNANPDQTESLPTATHAEFPSTGGVYVWYSDMKYPKKGWPFREAIWGINGVKRSLMVTARFLSSRPIRYFVPFFLILPTGWKKKIMREAIVDFTDVSEVLLRGKYLQPKFYCTMVREVYRCGMQLAGTDEYNILLVKAVCMILEFDDAYRFRAQDLLECFSKERFFKNPEKEIQYLVSILYQREVSSGLKGNAKRIGVLLGLLLRIKQVREPIFAFVKAIDLKQFYLDDCDWYHCLYWNGYDFRGINIFQRLLLKEQIDEDATHPMNTENNHQFLEEASRPK